ncbi:hypothetical protein FPSE5266_02988 [Fusarium pseudograminearum]|nr:hypothetical protein FPSE5266_02988 [Fusarium pseudograminearum]
MKLSLLFLLGGAGTAVIAGPCKSSTSSSTGQAGYASAAPEYETSIIGSVATSAIRYESPGVNQSDESDYVTSSTSAVEMPSGSNSVSNWLRTGSSDSTWLPGNTPTPLTSGFVTHGRPDGTHDSEIIVETSSDAETIRDGTATRDAPSGIDTKTKHIRTRTSADSDNTETSSVSMPTNTQSGSDHRSTAADGDLPGTTQAGIDTKTSSNGQSTDAISDIETVSGSTGDINKPAVTQSGLPASKTGTDAASTQPNASSRINTDLSGDQTTDATELVASTLTNTDTISTKESSVPKASESVSGSTDIDNTVAKATTAGSEETRTGTRTFVQDDNQTTIPDTDSNGSVIVGETTSIGSSPDSSRTSTGGSDGQGTTAGSDTRAPTSNATDTRSGLSPSVKTSSGQPIESSPSGSDAPKQEPSDSNSAIQTGDKPTKDIAAVPTVTDASPPKATDTAGDASITSVPDHISTTKSKDDGITSTLTVPPETFTPTTVSNDDWTTNTWITTTSESSDEPTVVPVLVGCPGCGGSGHGIVIFGLPPIPNALFKFPDLPEVSFPCVPGVSQGCSSPPKTHEDKKSDDDGDDKEEEEKSSKTTCIDIITASDCLVSCPTQNSNGDVECTTTCTRTQTGCSVSGITTTTSAEECSATEIGGSCTTCQKDVFFVNDKEEVEFIETGSVLERRASLHVENSALGKRSSPAVTITDLGACTLKRTDVEFPEYPSGGELFKADTTPNEKPTDTYFNTKKWYIGRQDPNTCARTLDKVSKQQFNSLAVSKKKTMGHVYEKSMLKDFFEQILDDNVATVQGVTKGSQGKINCADLSYYTDDDPNGASPNQLKQVFDAFPSVNKYLDDFMGMDEYSNAICKGTIVSSGNLPAEISKIATSGKLVKGGKKPTTWNLVTKWVEETLQTLKKLSIGVELWNNPDVQTIVIRQNRRIHSRFVNIKNNAKNCKQDVAVKNNVWSFSAAYQNYMNEFFQGTSSFSANPIVQKAADDLIAHMDANLVALGKRTLSADEQSQLTKWTTRYAPLKTSTYKVSISWDFSYTNLKRQDGDSCALPTSTLISSAASTTMSTLSTSYISQTNQEPTATEQQTHTETGMSWSGTCPSVSPFIDVDAKRNSTDEVDDRCICRKEPLEAGPPVPFTADQLEDILLDFCDGSRTLIKPGERNSTSIFKHYKLGDTSQLFILASWSYYKPAGCVEPTADLNLNENCKTAFRRLKCLSMDKNYGGYFGQIFDEGCVYWSIDPLWSSG